MNWVDLTVLAVLAVSAMLAFTRGFVREALGIGAWVGAAWIAARSFTSVTPQIRNLIPDHALADPAAFAIVFVVALIVLSVVASMIGKLVRGSVLGGLDRTLGLVFGIVRGFALMLCAYIAAGLLIPVQNWPEPVLKARALPYIYAGAVRLTEEVPEEYRPKLAAPAKADTRAQDYMQASPRGYATGRRPSEGQESK
ncbi:CvpA family protein [Granulibacter bethesdensis]|uniref:CvpA family protein n=1 Tax=Granulibacter bethesdensis TaxID=364410 RepID=UPI00090C2217|nr:CvpA family protein [Granulibacter bethesdensis]APH58781.1 Colicin V production protein [Granulibacter bethesdensis]